MTLEERIWRELHLSDKSLPNSVIVHLVRNSLIVMLRTYFRPDQKADKQQLTEIKQDLNSTKKANSVLCGEKVRCVKCSMFLLMMGAW